jgi:hypothetical protein
MHSESKIILNCQKASLIRPESASAIWPDKRGLLTIQNYFTLRVHLKSGLIRGVAIGKREGALLEGDYMY